MSKTNSGFFDEESLFFIFSRVFPKESPAFLRKSDFFVELRFSVSRI